MIKPPSYYNNENGSLYLLAHSRGWSSYTFDVVKRLSRNGKKDPLRMEIEKSITVLELMKIEFNTDYTKLNSNEDNHIINLNTHISELNDNIIKLNNLMKELNHKESITSIGEQRGWSSDLICIVQRLEENNIDCCIKLLYSWLNKI